MGRAEQAERTRAALLLAAAEEFEQRGFAATSLTDVSDRLGLVRATVHFHFATKKLLAAALVDHLAAVWHGIRSAADPGVPVDGFARLRWESEQVVAGYLRDPRQRAGLRLAIEPDLAPVPPMRQDWIDHVADLLAPSERADAAAVVVSSFAGVLVSFRRDGDADDAGRMLATFWELLETSFN